GVFESWLVDRAGVDFDRWAKRSPPEFVGASWPEMTFQSAAGLEISTARGKPVTLLFSHCCGLKSRTGKVRCHEDLISGSARKPQASLCPGGICDNSPTFQRW